MADTCEAGVYAQAHRKYFVDYETLVHDGRNQRKGNFKV